MMNTANSGIQRSIAIAVLCDDHGVSEEAWLDMREYLDEDIYNAVLATDGRFYLPEDWENA